MTTDQLMQWMANHRVPPTRCSRCHEERIAYWQDWQERPVCLACINGSRELDRAIQRRLHALNCDGPAEGCQECMEAGR